MAKRTAALVASGALVAAAVGAVIMTPASAATDDNPVTSRLAGIKSALSGLVSDGTITQEQADKVAETLEKKLPQHGPGGMGGHLGGRHFLGGLDVAAQALGMTEKELRAELQGGTSLADVAKAQGKSLDSLVAALVAAAEAKLATAVADGRLTQEQADTIKASLTARVTDLVNGVRPERGSGRGFPGPSDLPKDGSAPDPSGAATTSLPVTPAVSV